MTIEITSKAFLKLKYFIQNCETEISGFGKVREMTRDVEITIEDDDVSDDWWANTKWGKKPTETVIDQEKYLEIYDIEILPQIVSGVHATMSEETLAQFLMAKMSKGESTKDYKVWWHSHCDMEAYFSPVDENTIQRSTEFLWLISIVGNHAGDFKCRFDIQKPIAFSSPFKLVVQEPTDEKLEEWVISEIEKKVKVAEIGFKKGKKGSTYNQILEEHGIKTGRKLIDKNDIWD